MADASGSCKMEDKDRHIPMKRRALDSLEESTAKRRRGDPDSHSSSSILDWLDQIPALQPDLSSNSDMPNFFGKSSGQAKGSDSSSRRDNSSIGDNSSRRDSVEFAIPQTPASVITARSAATNSSSKTRLVERRDYQETNLEGNNIFFLVDDDLPDHVEDVVQTVLRDRSSPEPTISAARKEMQKLMRLQRYGAQEAEVQNLFSKKVFPSDDDDTIVRQTLQSAFDRNVVPNKNPEFPVSKPIPDIAYGYKARDGSFTDNQKAGGALMNPHLGAVGDNMSFPFFIIELKADGPTQGALWVATNQCLGGSASCVEVVDRLNYELQKCAKRREEGGRSGEPRTTVKSNVDNTSFSIAMDQNTAKLYVTWKTEECRYYVQQANVYTLGRPDNYLEFRRHVKNILDWGAGPRFAAIQKALDYLLEEDQRLRSEERRRRFAPTTSSYKGTARTSTSRSPSVTSSSRLSGPSDTSMGKRNVPSTDGSRNEYRGDPRLARRRSDSPTRDGGKSASSSSVKGAGADIRGDTRSGREKDARRSAANSVTNKDIFRRGRD